VPLNRDYIFIVLPLNGDYISSCSAVKRRQYFPMLAVNGAGVLLICHLIAAIIYIMRGFNRGDIIAVVALLIFGLIAPSDFILPLNTRVVN